MGGMGGMGGMPVGICGDGNVDSPTETCDDGGTMNGDGCSAMCLTEPGNTCPGYTLELAPGMVMLQGETDGSGKDYNPICGPSNLNEVFYEVKPTASGTLTITLAKGSQDKSISILSGCAAPGIPKETYDLSCASGTVDVVHEIWVHAGVSYFIVVEAQNGTYDLTLELNACGDGVKSSKEQCEVGDANCVGCVLCGAADEFSNATTKHCYRSVTAAADFRNARTECVNWGGDLVGISSKAEFDFIAASAKISNDAWSGGYALTPGCSHGWVNGEPWRSNWVGNQPDNTNDACVMMVQNSAQAFDDKPCNESHAYVCERVPAGKCGDSIVQPGEECDDGNMANLDGCSTSCKRDEPCADVGGLVLNNHCYWYESAAATWSNAKNTCEGKGGYLVAIESMAERDLIDPWIVGETWTGGWEGNYNSTNTIFWEAPPATCGYVPTNSNFSSTSQDCVRQDPDGTWHDSGCTETKPSVCERDWQ